MIWLDLKNYLNDKKVFPETTKNWQKKATAVAETTTNKERTKQYLRRQFHFLKGFCLSNWSKTKHLQGWKLVLKEQSVAKNLCQLHSSLPFVMLRKESIFHMPQTIGKWQRKSHLNFKPPIFRSIFTENVIWISIEF